MGTRVIKRRGPSSRRRKAEARVIAAIITAVGLPVILAGVLVAMDMRTDLSELKPRTGDGGSGFPGPAAALIGWPELETVNGRPVSLEEPRWHLQPRARMLGYMMDGYKASRDGERVKMFVLLPEAGQFLHPAHRIPDQMVEVRLTRPAAFTYRRLVWVSGVLARTPGRRDPDKALYAMADGIVENAEGRDIARWFQP